MPDKMLKKNPDTPVSGDVALFGRIVDILEEARSHVVRTVNSAMVVAYWLIGREIVEELQGGAGKAEFGKQVIAGLSLRLTERYGRGFSVPNLRNFRQFYLVYEKRHPEIRYPLRSELENEPEKRYTARSELRKSKKTLPTGKRIDTKAAPNGC